MVNRTVHMIWWYNVSVHSKHDPSQARQIFPKHDLLMWYIWNLHEGKKYLSFSFMSICQVFFRRLFPLSTTPVMPSNLLSLFIFLFWGFLSGNKIFFFFSPRHLFVCYDCCLFLHHWSENKCIFSCSWWKKMDSCLFVCVEKKTNVSPNFTFTFHSFSFIVA